MQLRYTPEYKRTYSVEMRYPAVLGSIENTPLIMLASGEVLLKSDLYRDIAGQERLFRASNGTLEVVTWSKRPVLYTPEGEKLVKSQVFAMNRGSDQYPMRAMWYGSRTILMDHEHNVAVPLACGFNGIYAEWPHYTAMPCTHTSWGWYVQDKVREKMVTWASKYIFEQASVRAALFDSIDNSAKFTQHVVEVKKGLDDILLMAKIRQDDLDRFLSRHNAVSLVCLAAVMVDTSVGLFVNQAKTSPFKFTKTSRFMKDRINKARTLRESKFLCLTDEGIK